MLVYHYIQILVAPPLEKPIPIPKFPSLKEQSREERKEYFKYQDDKMRKLGYFLSYMAGNLGSLMKGL
jgi:hypothetical protein|tara:strand:+ start:308 stop:511 length:204 start_codon:yes stop_codon:yes gene_type:complete